MQAKRKNVSFIGIGAGAAPTLLYSHIKSHPEVYVLPEETTFFSNTKVFAKGIGWYEGQFAGAASGLIAGELATEYLQNIQSAGLIARLLPDVRLLAVIENPLVAVRIAYVEARRTQSISAKVSLAQFLKQNPEVLMNARYGRQLTPYFGYYAPTDFFVVTAEEVRNNTLAVLKKTFLHLGVNGEYIPPLLTHLIPEDENEIKFKPGLIKRAFRAIGRGIRGVYRLLARKINPPDIPLETAYAVAKRIPLSPELEEFLKKYYRADVAVLSRLLYRNLGVEWGIDEEEGTENQLTR